MVRTPPLARGLGLFSLGLGLVQVAAPRRFSRWIGARPDSARSTLVRLVGAREILAASGLLVGQRPVAFFWMRVLGDVMDLALLGRAHGAPDVARQRISAAMTGVAAVTALDLGASVIATGNGSATAAMQGGKPTVKRAITVNRPRDEVYTYWRQLENLPRFMRHLDSVEQLDGRRSHWKATGPMGSHVEWDAELTEEVPGERIAWRSLPDADVHHAGTVWFADAPRGQGTEIHVEFEYSPPGGPIGATVAKLFNEEPSQQVGDDLRRFKQVLETGDVIVSEATVGDRRIRQRPAQPVTLEEVAV